MIYRLTSDIVGSVPDHHDEAESNEYFDFPLLYKSFVYIIL